jgi:acetoin utilization deacetylase AcuC-like enzyme
VARLTELSRGKWRARPGSKGAGETGRGPLHLVSSPQLRRHAPDSVPERPERLDWAAAGVLVGLGLASDLESSCGSLPGYWEPDAPLTTEQMALVHTRSYLEYLSQLSARGGGMIAIDTEVTADSAWSGRLAAAAADLGSRLAVADHRPALVLVRPPGHHAGVSSGSGFCLYNNAAVAARLHLARGGRRVAILDWDVHHGNGTQQVFWTDPAVLYISLHESPLYPFTGWLHEVGQADGRGRTVNLPLPGGLDNAGALLALESIALPCIRQFAPDLILISAGQDGHHTDPMSTWRLTAGGYMAMAAGLRELARDLGAGLAAILEGGYTPGGLGLGLAGIVAGLTGQQAPAAVTADEPRSGDRRPPALGTTLHQALAQIRAVQREFWSLA